MPRTFVAAMLAALLAAPAAMADQYLARIDTPYDAASPGLLESLRITEIDAFSHDGAHFVVIEAPNESYIEALFLAIHRTPSSLFELGANWWGPGLAHLSMEQRFQFLHPMDCNFCVG